MAAASVAIRSFKFLSSAVLRRSPFFILSQVSHLA
mgnify:FL=1